MALYYYVKAPPNSLPPKGQNKLFSILMVGFGILILGLVLGSFGFYQIQSKNRFEQKKALVSPLPRGLILGKSQENTTSPDLMHPQRWFSSPPPLPFKQSKITHYNLSIPVLGIYQAVVEIGGEDLGKSMVHYPGTSYPGETGKAVVFCHSVLPQFFDPKNYKTVCSTLPTVELGDEISVYFDGIRYTYQVIEMFEVQPSDVSVLEQDLSGEYLSMITCVPPGTYLRRLVVKARLI